MRREQRDEEFADYVAARRGTLLRAAWLLCGDPHRAEDLVQTALTRLYVKWPTLRHAAGIDAYARRTIVNANIDDHRRSGRREHLGLDGIDPVGSSPFSSEERESLWAALRSLPLGQRRVVVLRYLWGLSIEETAADLGCSVGTVKSQSSLATARLRTTLTPEFDRRGQQP